MIYFSILLAIFNAYLIARYARDKYALTLSGSYLFSSVAIASYISVAFNYDLLTSSYYWGFVIVCTIMIYFLSNLLRYFIAWLFSLLIITMVVILPLELTINSTTSLISAIAAAIPVYIYRNEIKLVLIGLMSGTNLILGIMILLFKLSPISFYESLSKLSSLLYLLGTASGVYFQFKLYDKYFPSKIADTQETI